MAQKPQRKPPKLATIKLTQQTGRAWGINHEFNLGEDRFKIEEVLRRGNHDVYKARRQGDNELKHIKRYAAEAFTGFERETQAYETMQRKGSHQNIVNLERVFEDGQNRFTIFPFLTGQSWDKYIDETQHTPTTEETLLIALQICKGLNFIHSTGLIHRDIKPSNIFLKTSNRFLTDLRTRKPVVKITDFDIARKIKVDSDDEDEDKTAGTPMYMSPEVLLAPDSADSRADIFSLGISCYEALVNVRPYKGHDTEDIMSRVLFWEPIQPRMICPSIPQKVEEIVMRMMDKRPNKRYQNAQEAITDIKDYLREL